MTRVDSEKGAEGAALRRIVLEYENSVCHAFSSGYSVVEIAREIGCKRALPVYRTVQARGLIDRSVRKTRYRGPAQMEMVLLRAGLSFTKWCNSWRFDPKTAEEELSTPDAPSSSEIRQAAARDFPSLFEKRDGSVDLEKWEREISSLSSGYSYSIDWEPRLEKYSGTISGMESITIIGKHPSVIIIKLVKVTWLLKAIERLGAIEKDKCPGITVS